MWTKGANGVDSSRPTESIQSEFTDIQSVFPDSEIFFFFANSDSERTYSVDSELSEKKKTELSGKLTDSLSELLLTHKDTEHRHTGRVALARRPAPTSTLPDCQNSEAQNHNEQHHIP